MMQQITFLLNCQENSNFKNKNTKKSLYMRNPLMEVNHVAEVNQESKSEPLNLSKPLLRSESILKCLIKTKNYAKSST